MTSANNAGSESVFCHIVELLFNHLHSRRHRSKAAQKLIASTDFCSKKDRLAKVVSKKSAHDWIKELHLFMEANLWIYILGLWRQYTVKSSDLSMDLQLFLQ